MGIGTSSPLYDLHIKQQNANIGLTDAATNKVSATITASDEDVIMNAYRSTGAGGHIIFQRSGFIGGNPLNAGNVGIGVPFPLITCGKLQVNGNIRVQNANGKLVLHDGSVAKGRYQSAGTILRSAQRQATLQGGYFSAAAEMQSWPCYQTAI